VGALVALQLTFSASQCVTQFVVGSGTQSAEDVTGCLPWTHMWRTLAVVALR